RVKSGFGRIAAQVAKQVILQKIREAEKDVVLKEYAQRVGTLANGMILRFEGSMIIVDVGKAEAIMPPEEQVKSERYQFNQRLTFYIKEIREMSRGRRVIASRADKGLVEGLFRREVPEVNSGAVVVKKIAREPGSRSKVAVASTQPGVDPVGSCVGQKGVRVQEVISELAGEKIDIIPHSDDLGKFIIAALSPAEKVKVTIDEERKEAVVSVPDDQLSLAIGKEGQNVRLAAKLTGFRIDIQGMDAKKKKIKEAVKKSDSQIAGLSTRVGKLLASAGITSKADLEQKKPKEIRSIKGLGPKALEEIKKVLQEKS
ncbi:transcription termination factor NusA, partial [Patescibacteria group bacterium]